METKTPEKVEIKPKHFCCKCKHRDNTYCLMVGKHVPRKRTCFKWETK